MSSDWQDVKLSEIVDFQNGYAFSSREYVPKSPESKEVLRMGYIQRGGGFKEDDKPVYAPLSSKGSDARYCLEEGDIVIAMTDMKDRVAILANCAQIPSSGRFLLNQRVGRIRSKDRELVDQKYLYYFMNSPPQVQYLRSMANRGVQVNLTTSAIVDSLVSLPLVVEQKGIAHILGTLDDKIELNRKTNETLEGIAKALFKSWFVDFDPVRENTEGRPTGLPDEISELFPDSFVESELGEIPSGWSVAMVGDCSLEIESGKRPKGGINKGLSSGVPSIGAESIDAAGLFDFGKTKYVPEEFASSVTKGWVRELDVALYKDGGKPGEFKPRVAIYGSDFPFPRFMVNEHVFLLRSVELGQSFLYHLFGFDLVREQIIHMGSSKGAQPGLNQQEVKSSVFVKPTESILRVFSEVMEVSTARQFHLGKQNLLLEQLRDALLPRLISGELRVPDAEKMLEEAGV